MYIFNCPARRTVMPTCLTGMGSAFTSSSLYASHALLYIGIVPNFIVTRVIYTLDRTNKGGPHTSQISRQDGPDGKICSFLFGLNNSRCSMSFLDFLPIHKNVQLPVFSSDIEEEKINMRWWRYIWKQCHHQYQPIIIINLKIL